MSEKFIYSHGTVEKTLNEVMKDTKTLLVKIWWFVVAHEIKGFLNFFKK